MGTLSSLAHAEAPSETLDYATVAGLLLIIFLQLALLANRNSATWDEADHTYAGYMQWTHGDFGLNAEHPLLVKFPATLSLLPMHLRQPPLLDQPYRLQEVRGGVAFVFGNDANAILLRARLAASVLTLLLAFLVFAAACGLEPRPEGAGPSESDQPVAALAEAQQAEALAPQSATVNATLGHALDANAQPAQAAPYFQRALTLVQTVEPAFQTKSIAGLEQRLGGSKPR